MQHFETSNLFSYSLGGPRADSFLSHITLPLTLDSVLASSPMSEDHHNLTVTRWLSNLQSPQPTPTRPKRKRDSKEHGLRSKRLCAHPTARRSVLAQIEANMVPAPVNQTHIPPEDCGVRKSSRTPSPPKRYLSMVCLTPAPESGSVADHRASLRQH